MININCIDSVNLKIECEKDIARELSSFFTFTVPNYQYTPAYKNRLWDGKIRLFNSLNYTIYAGLLDYVYKFAEDRFYKVECVLAAQDIEIKQENVDSFLSSFECYGSGKKLILHNHQTEAINYALLKKRCLLISPTGSGKSLMIYAAIKYLLYKIPENKKILVIVPTTGLVSQLLNDFHDYSNKDGFIRNCHVIYSGKEKESNRKIVISTWQSIYKMKEEYFKDFYCVFGDECHLFKAKSLTTIMTKLKECPVRIGTTGTLDGTHIHKLVIEGLFGRVFNVTSTKELMEKDLLTNLKIEGLVLQYNPQEIQEMKRATYIDEIQWLISNKKRNKFIVDLCCNLKGNTLVLFNFVEKHGLPLFDRIKKQSNKSCYLIYGKTQTEDRESIRQVVNKQKESILVASYGTCSTGINIKNIDNIVFTSPSKSVIRVLQSIGRGLRKSENKDKVTLYDIGDDLRYKNYRNHSLRHMNDRIQIYTNERFVFKTTNIRLQETT